MIKTDNVTVFQMTNNDVINVDIDNNLFVMKPEVFKNMIVEYIKNNPVQTMEDYLKGAKNGK